MHILNDNCKFLEVVPKLRDLGALGKTIECVQRHLGVLILMIVHLNVRVQKRVGSLRFNFQAGQHQSFFSLG